MPHQKHVKSHRNKADANNNFNANNVNNNANGGPHVQEGPANNGKMQQCCFPGGACTMKEELIDTANVEKSVRVVCNNDSCISGNWMHKTCFDEWEQSVLAYLRSCGRARSWSEKQRLQNLWTKKGYDLAFKACDCNCGKGHLRKDLDYIPPRTDELAPKKKTKKKTLTKPELNTTAHPVRERRTSGNGNTNANTVTVGSPITTKTNPGFPKLDNAHIGTKDVIRRRTPSISIPNLNDERMRANSIGSTGSSPPNSASSTTSGSDSPVLLQHQNQSHQSSSLHNNTVICVPPNKGKFDFTPHVSSPSNSNAASTSIFRKRHDLSAFNVLPKHKQNAYHIKMEDDVLNGNDEVHTFVLNHLGTHRVTSLNCVLCKNELAIFDRYPLIDGTLFLSPQAYDNHVIQVISEGRLQYINAVCVSCLEGGNDIRCAACKRRWDGSALLLGSMYSYDIFAAMPCCQKRLSCKHCRRAVVDVTSGLPYYSEYSHMIACPYCKAHDYHFIRPLNETFQIKMSIWH